MLNAKTSYTTTISNIKETNFQDKEEENQLPFTLNV